MVDYKTRVFFEPDSDTVGAEVKIYSSSGEEIDTIYITTQENWNRLYEKLNNLDETYLDKDELLSILTNGGESVININATTLNGLNSDQFAKANHNELHVNSFAPISHAINTTRYGVGSTDKYGHVKTIDNLNSTGYVSGEALSAYQGKLLHDDVNDLQKIVGNRPSEILKDSSMLQPNRFTSGSYVRFRKWGNVVTIDIHATCNSNQDAQKYLHICTIPGGYAPTDYVQQSFYNNNSGTTHGGIITVIPDQGVKFYLPEKFKPAINCNLTYLVD